MGQKGIVHIVGAGPGDPGLLTLRALELLRAADVVVYDRLVGQGVLDLIPVGATRIHAGKERGRCAMTQDETNDLLVRLARTGHDVVRLKGGDPFIFGRGGEEALHLAEHGIACQVVPGITAAAACAASVGIPLTHRGVSSSLHFLTGHRRDDGATPELPWRTLADPHATVVVYMGLANVDHISRQLLEAGLSGDTPAVVVERGSTNEQRHLRASLETLPQVVREAAVVPPALLIIGNVVSLSERLATHGEWAVPAPRPVAGAR